MRRDRPRTGPLDETLRTLKPLASTLESLTLSGNKLKLAKIKRRFMDRHMLVEGDEDADKPACVVRKVKPTSWEGLTLCAGWRGPTESGAYVRGRANSTSS